MPIRRCADDDFDAILAIVNLAAEAYRGVIPADRWHEPYMPATELTAEIGAGVEFWGYEDDTGRLVGVMGIQPVRDVDLIRHAYVLPESQGSGVGGRLLQDLVARAERPLLVGTWADATWAIGFYQRHGFTVCSRARTAELLKAYWTIPDRQIETSVVLEGPPRLQAEVDPEIFARYPDYRAVVLVAEGFSGGPTSAESDAALRDAEQYLRGRGLERAADHPHIASWRAAFSSFGAKPSKYNCSAEALASRVLKGGELPRISSAVDLYNAVSVRYLIPVGGEDLDRLEGPLRLTFAEDGEVVWRDDVDVTCRRWNWRQGERTRLTEQSTRGFFVFDRLAGLDLAELDAAVDTLESALAARGARTSRIGLGPS